MRAPSSETKTGLKKGPWSLEEDELLKAYINRYGIWNWTHMPKFAGLSRSGKSCRLRWMNYLKPNLKRGNFSREDEDIILHYHSILGNRWSTIALKLPGRSDNEIKNYWHTHLKKRSIHKECEANGRLNDDNGSLLSESEDVEKIRRPNDQASDVSESFFSSTSEDDCTSTSTSTSKDHEVEIKGDYYDIGSPGTVEDLQYFWEQLCTTENLDFGNFDHDTFYDPNFQDSYGNTINPYYYKFYNTDYDTIDQAFNSSTILSGF